MRQYKTLSNPGFLSDLFTLFTLNFNTDYYLINPENSGNQSKDADFFTKTLEEFGPVSEDMLLFFILNENDKAFIPVYYFDLYKNIPAASFDFEFLKGELRDKDRLAGKLLLFFFPNLTENSANNLLSSPEKLFALIKESEYGDVIKLKMYEFFINPSPVIEKLLAELSSKEKLLSAYYEKHRKMLDESQSNLDFDALCGKIKSPEGKPYKIEQGQAVYVSICLIDKNHAGVISFNDGVVVLLGFDCVDKIKHSKQQYAPPELDAFGSAISEKNRLRILEIIRTRPGLTVKEIERELDITASTAHFHITIMTRLNMIKTRNKGRTIHYSLNRGYFDEIMDVISIYSTKHGD